MGRVEDAQENLKQALAYNEEHQDRYGQVRTLNCLGDLLYMSTSKLDEVQEALNKALNTPQIARLCKSLGAVDMRMDRFQDAEVDLNKSLAYYKKLEDKFGQVRALWSLRDLYTRIYRFDDSKQALCNALVFYEEINDTSEQA
ncbi:hypothetical protein GYMLUDRAFT_64839 [Collybiopsis luxurians FD-317 M1]|uniref:Uncharacterized protein n=1 Tax=Collybiopsis luxurians FD-317 M1 TaxID=944289 RepID=A0A0D0C119_9AGAR|nr:hypothetical protein GYMLUDRAFT_64839 [Collybiopsis luxurians FD-317 M1]